MSIKSDDLDSIDQNSFHYDHHEDVSLLSNKNDGKMILEQERFLPIANISRIMKRVIPESGKLSKEAKECIQECVTEFLLFITSEASEKCLQEKRKTITGEDLLTAFQALGFDDYLDPLKEFLQKFREANKLEKPKVELNDDNQHESEALPSSSQLHPSSSAISHGEMPMAAIAVEQSRNAPTTLQSIQMFVDPATGQHYVTVQNQNGTQSLLPVQLSATSDTAKPIVGTGSSAQIVQTTSDSSEGASHCVTTYYTADL